MQAVKLFELVVERAVRQQQYHQVQQDTKRRPEQPRGSDGEKKGAGAGKTKPTDPTKRKDKKPSAPRSGCLICKGEHWAVDCPTTTDTQKEKELQAVKDKRQRHTNGDTVDGCRVVLNSTLELPLCVDTGSDVNVIPKRAIDELKDVDPTVRCVQLSAPIEVTVAAGGKLTAGFRMDVDYKPVSSWVVPIAGSTPPTPAVESDVRGYSVFGLFDYVKGLLAKACRELYSILTEDGGFTPMRIPQSACDSATHFQMETEDCFKEMLDVAVLIWIDDFAPSPAEYLVRLRQIFEICCARVLYTPSARWSMTVKDPQRLIVLQELPPPPTAAALQQFLCSLNGLRESMVDYARVVAPIQEKLEMVMKSRERRKVSLVGCQLDWSESDFGALRAIQTRTVRSSFSRLGRRLMGAQLNWSVTNAGPTLSRVGQCQAAKPLKASSGSRPAFVWPTRKDLRALEQRHHQARPVDAGLEDGLVWVGERVWVPGQDRDMILRLLRIAHCGAQAHRGEHRGGGQVAKAKLGPPAPDRDKYEGTAPIVSKESWQALPVQLYGMRLCTMVARGQAPEGKQAVIHVGWSVTVRDICDHRQISKAWEVLVAWRGLQDEENAWKPVEQIARDVPGLLRQYIPSSLNRLASFLVAS
ncbi:TPA: LOW QUALITY PROTEIN: hypothetical protein N0F65_011711 [Lagenidium giganteum]|uniref:Chromo domain-containing protein n=1 Tax=Lagenidium giganteum TaxID=4803 RepID=A0AAV2YYI1_9STRA|nr:TPA: LOW QUALITY PROTEIN: hypothetical protein N0F65_011711 [Lagenidium giganteum]